MTRPIIVELTLPGCVLVIDRVKTNRIVLKAILSAACYDVRQAGDWDEAMAEVSHAAPDLILVDTDLGLDDGRALCRHLHTTAETAGIPIMLTTSSKDGDIVLSGLSAGAVEVLCRPIDPPTLLARVRSLLRTRTRVQQNERLVTDGLSEPGVPFRHAAPVISKGRIGCVSNPDTHPDRQLDTCGETIKHDVYLLSPQQVLSGQLSSLDVLILDLDLRHPGGALTLLSEVRAHPDAAALPILLRGEHAAPDMIARGLDLGADDVVVHSATAGEMSLRLAALIRRKRQEDVLRLRLKDGMLAAVTDPLTELANRRAGLQRLSQIAQRAGADGHGFAVLILDIDHFKSVNDAFGHAAGDTVLREMGQRLRDSIGRGDIVARIGGEEFLVAIPDSDGVRALELADHLRQTLASKPVQIGPDQPEIWFSASIGVATGPLGKVGDGTDVLAAADAALYCAKAKGRNQVCLQTEEDRAPDYGRGGPGLSGRRVKTSSNRVA